MPDFEFQRQCRTPYSEAYNILENGERVGRVDLHFTPTEVEALLTVGEDLDGERIQYLIDVIDEELVMTADVPRDDFVVTVHQGHEVGVFSDDVLVEEEDDEGGNGAHP